MADIARIKGNISKMIAQNAPESDIDTYVASEGVSLDQLQSKAEQPPMLADIAKGTLSGVASGVVGLAGLPGDLAGLLNRGVDWGLSKLGVEPTIPTSRDFGTSKQIQSAVEGVTGEFYKPQTTTGKFARTVGEFLPGSAIGPGGWLSRGATAVGAGLGSEAAGQATEGTALEPYARVGGAFLGGLAPSAAARAITPLPANAARQQFVNTLEAEGVPLTAGQRSGRESLRYAESALGNAPGSGGRAAQAMEAQGEAFTAAALRRAGENATRATPDVIDGAFRRIGQQFDDLAARNWAEFDGPFVRDLQRVHRDYSSLVPESQRAPIVDHLLNDIYTIHRNGGQAMTGEAYQAMRSRIDGLARNAGRDPQLAEALRGIRNALDDVTERTIFRRNPNDLGAWREARRQYRNMLVIEKAATGAGENAAQGLISPSQLRNATMQQNRRGYARGQGDFADLARAGEAVMKPLPQSGTGPRTLATAIPAAVGSTVGSLFGPAGTGLGALGGAVLGATTPGLTGRALMSRPVQAWLNNQRFAGLSHDQASRQALIQAMLEGPRAALPAR